MKNIFISTVVLGLSLSSLAFAHEDGTVHPHIVTTTASASGSPVVGVEGGMLQARPVIATSSQMCVKFYRSLGIGARGREVSDLQTMLIENGYLKSEATGYFGQMTKAAVVKYQKDNGVSPTGYFGELSRKHHEKRCGDVMGFGKGDGSGNGTSSKLYPCPLMACKEGSACLPCGGKPIPPMGTTTWKPDDRLPIHCTMEARMCPDGTMMPRDNMCVWHPEKCAVLASTTISGTVTQ